MARTGAVTLSDVTDPYLTIGCTPCGRRGRYAVRRLEAKHGNAGLPDMLVFLTRDCPKRASSSELDRCVAKYNWPNGPPSARER